MSYIDKTYVNIPQWKEAKKFIEETKEEQINAFGKVIHLYYTEEEVNEINDNKKEFVLWNTSFIQDVWLYQNCKLSFVQKRLTEQYGKNKSPLFENIDFSNNCISIVKAESNDEKIIFDFWMNDEDSNDNIILFDDNSEILLYGTTLMLTILNEIKLIVKGYKYDYFFKGRIIINFFGCHILYENEETYIYDGNNIKIKIDMSGIYISDDYFNLPKINYSFKHKDFTRYNPYMIYFSDEKEVCQLTHYKNWESLKGNTKNLGRFAIPEYILKMMK